MLVKILIPIRRVPDTTAKVTIAADGSSVNETGIKFVLNPYDEFALEAGLALKEGAGAGEVVAGAFGPDSAQETLRTALAMGADSAVHLQGKPSADGLANARVIADHVKGRGYDLVLFGKLAVDDYNQQTGPMTAELLGLPCATAITSLSVAGGVATVEREVEGGVETATCSLPAVFTCDKGLNTPRLPSLKGIMAAKKKPLEVVPASVGDGMARVVSLSLPAERAAGVIVGEGAAAVPALMEALISKAKVL